MNVIIYDCEIVKAIAKKNEELLGGIEYCEGWRDFGNMEISVIGAYDYATDRYRVFAEDNFDEFQKLVDSSELVVGFNSIAFDNRLCEANDLIVSDEKSYDLLVEIWKAAGLGKEFDWRTHAGFGLDACAKANFHLEKTGHGALAPVDWQRGNIGKVVDYCLNDVYLTKRLFDEVLKDGWVNDPRDSEKMLFLKGPDE